MLAHIAYISNKLQNYRLRQMSRFFKLTQDLINFLADHSGKAYIAVLFVVRGLHATAKQEIVFRKQEK